MLISLKNALAPLALGVAASVVLGATLFWLAGGTDTPSVERAGLDDDAFQWRFVIIDKPPSESGLRLRGDVPLVPEQPWLIRVNVLSAEGDGAVEFGQELGINAETGEVVQNTLPSGYRDEVAAILASVRIDKTPSGWPIEDGPLPDATASRDNLVYREPAGSAGFFFAFVIEGGTFLFVSNSRSYIHINSQSGEVQTFDSVLPEDREAFARFVDNVLVQNR